jgi:hypothetical protein
VAGNLTIYNLGSAGVVVDKSEIHEADGELLRAQNWQTDAVGGRGALRRRDGLLALNAAPLAGPVLGGIGVPLPDRALLQRVFYLPLNDNVNSFLVSTDGASWSATPFPSIAEREGTLGIEALFPVFGDAALIWRGFADTLYYPGDEHVSGLTLPSVHAWNDIVDVAIAHVPPNPADLGTTFGPFGVTSILPFGPSQLLIVAADRTGGRARVLLLDLKNGSLSQVGAATDLAAGYILAGIVVWQGRVWIAGANIAPGSPLVTRWIRPGDATWTTDDSFSTTHGYCTGLVTFRGELYQGSAADAGQHGLIRRRRQAAGGSATRVTSVLGGSSTIVGVTSTVQGGSTTVVGGSSTVSAGSSTVVSSGAVVVVGSTTITQRPNPTAAGTAVAYNAGGSPPGIVGTWHGEYTWLYSDGAESLISPTSNGISCVGTTTSGMHFTAVAGDSHVTGMGWYLTTPGGAVGLYFTLGGFDVQAITPSGVATAPPTTPNNYAAGSTYLYVADTSSFSGTSARVGAQTFAYTGRSTSSGAGYLSGVSGIASTIAVGATIEALTAATDVPIGATSLSIADTTAFLSAGSASVSGLTITYTGRSTSSGAGVLTGVAGISSAIAFGSAITGVIPVSGASIPIADTSTFSSAGAAVVSGQSITYTGRSTGSGAGVLTGVSGVTTAIANGSAIVNVVPIGATSVRVANTMSLLATAGAVTISGQTITYTGKSTTSGPGSLTGVSGVTTAIANGATVTVVVPIGSTNVPVADVTIFPTSGAAIVSGQALAYTGKTVGGYGAAPGLVLVAGAGLDTGVYGFALSNVTALGESLPNAVGSITTGAGGHQVAITAPLGPPGTTGRNLYRTLHDDPQLLLIGLIGDNVTTAIGTDTRADSVIAGNAHPPTVDTSGLGQPGVLTGVSGVSVAITVGSVIVSAVSIGATSIPVADTATLLVPGAASVGGITVRFTGRSTTSGAGDLTGVTGVTVALGAGAAISLSVPAGATAVPVADTTNFLSAGGPALVGAQSITYTGRSTVSGPGVLTGVTGVGTPATVGTSVSVVVAAAAVWSTVYTSDGTGAMNYVGPLIVTADGAVLLAFRNSVSGGAAPQIVILRSVDGVLWTTEYNITDALGNGYGRSGMPFLDTDGDGEIYWPLASGSAGGSGGLLKRTPAGVWSVVLSGLTNIRGPLGIARVDGGA